MDAQETSRSRRANWSLFLIIGLTVFTLTPLFNTGYLCDDATNSLLPAAIKFGKFTFPEYALTIVKKTTQSGRFFPIAMVYYTGFFYVVRSYTLYKSLVIAAVLLDLALFHRFATRVSRSPGFASLATALVVPLLQFRAFFDPLLAFNGMLQLVVAATLVSLIALQDYLDTGRRKGLAVSVGAYLFLLLLYEVSYPFIAIYALMICVGRRGFVSKVSAALPYASVLAGCTLASLLARRYAVSESNFYAINRDPSDFALALLRQTSAGLPLSYFSANPTGLFPSPRDVVGMARMVGTLGGLLAFAAALGAMFVSFGAVAEAGESQRRGLRIALTGAIGLMVAVLPGFLISVSARHQALLGFGLGYLPVYIQYFGVALVLATAVWLVVTRLPAGGVTARSARVSLAVLAAAVTCLNYRANTMIAESLTVSPDSPKFNPRVGKVGAAFNHHRENLEQAIRAGLMDRVPEHSAVVLANEYPSWYERAHSRYFFAAHSGKVFATAPLTAKYDSLPCWFIRKEGFPPPDPASVANPYVVRDVSLGRRGGYVVLSRSKPEGNDADVRVFVRHPALVSGESRRPMSLTGRACNVPDGHPGKTIVCRGSDLTLLKTGKDWALYSLADTLGSVDPGTLVVNFGPVSHVCSDGFYAHEMDPSGGYRWGKKRAVVVMTNVTERPRKVHLRMRLQHMADGPILVDGTPASDSTVAPMHFVDVDRELTLYPGTNPVDISTGASKVPVPRHETRELYFRMSNLTVEDHGPQNVGGPVEVPVVARNPAADRVTK